MHTLDEGRKFHEDVIETAFGLSVSKLRSAQRLRLVLSDASMNADRRTIRVWALSEVAKVFSANMVSYHLQIPFLAAVESVVTYQKMRGINLGDTVTFCDYFRAYPAPKTNLYDRSVLTATDDDPERQFSLGRLEPDQTGRMQFIEHSMAIRPLPGEWTSCATIDFLKVRQAFRKIVDSLP